MKTPRLRSILAILLASLLPACHLFSHGEETASGAFPKQAGPNGGRLITAVDPHAEFLLLEERYVQIAFVDHDGQIVAPEQQTVTLVGGSRSAPTKLTFEPSGNVLRSTAPLPDQPRMPIILQIKPSPDGKTIRERFYLNESICGGCDHPEYACLCGH